MDHIQPPGERKDRATPILALANRGSTTSLLHLFSSGEGPQVKLTDCDAVRRPNAGSRSARIHAIPLQFAHGEARVVEYELAHAQPSEPVENLLGRHPQGARVADFTCSVRRRYAADLIVGQPPIGDPVPYIVTSHNVVHGWRGSGQNPTGGRWGTIVDKGPTRPLGEGFIGPKSNWRAELASID